MALNGRDLEIMDPRRRIDRKCDIAQHAKIPFLESYRETVLEGQSLGASLEHDMIVIRIDRRKLILYSLLLGFIVLLGAAFSVG